MYKNIPKELKEVNNWCCYKLEHDEARPNKPRKIPINANNGGYAKSNDPSTWSSYDVAVDGIGKYGEGLGFFFSPPYFGVDIDDIKEDIEKYKTGDSDNILSEFIHTLGSYAEYSQSGNGIHIICKGELPDGARRRGNVEMYQSGRYFITTGDVASEYSEIIDATENIKYLHAKHLGGGEIKQSQININDISIDLSEEKIIDIAKNSKNGQAFNTLFQGFWQGLYPSQSEADLSFANMLAFFTARNFNKMDSIFRKSGLYRPKWDSRRASSTYGAGVLNKAIADCTEVFVPGNGIEDYAIKILDHKIKRYAFDDTGNADRFVGKFKTTARFSYVDKAWWFYNSKKWEYDNTGKIKQLTEDILKEMKIQRAYCQDEDEEKAYDKHLKYTRNNRGKTNMIKESEHRLSILPHEFDQRTDAFNCLNGVLDLKTGTLHEHKYEQYLSKISPVEYTDNIDHPKWTNFLNDIFDNDQELIKYIQKAVGYSMTGSTREQCMFFCYGNGANGKSTFLEVVGAILGDYAVNIQPETIMVKNNQGANSDIARLKGARFITTVEPNEGARLNEGLVKQLTGGDTVTARRLYGNEFEFSPEFKLWMGTNHKPIIRGRDEGIWRRMHMIPFMVTIPDHKKDKMLKHKLKKELPGILNWAVQGCLLWQIEGLKMPTKVMDAVKEYRSEMDVVSAFLGECVVKAPGIIEAGKLYKAYADWAEENNEYKMSNTKFGKEIALRFERGPMNYGRRTYEGLKLIDEPYKIEFQKWNK